MTIQLVVMDQCFTSFDTFLHTKKDEGRREWNRETERKRERKNMMSRKILFFPTRKIEIKKVNMKNV